MKKTFDTSFFLLLGIFLFSVEILNAQRVVTGTIKVFQDSSVLLGASILVPNSTIGTVSDIDGKFSLTVPDSSTVLEINYVGFKKVIVGIPSSDVVEIFLEEDKNLLTTPTTCQLTYIYKLNVGSALNLIYSPELNQGFINDVPSSLQSKVAGLAVAKPGDDPNEMPIMRIRGVSAPPYSQSPLIVVDDVPGIPLSSIDVNDIESITVLKDASATAGYGYQAASGSLLIKTKKSNANQTKVIYSTQVSVSNVANKIQNLSVSEFIEAGGNNFGNQTDWLKTVTRQGISFHHKLGISIGSFYKTHLHLVLNYNNVQGITLNDGYKNLGLRFNFTQHAFQNKLNLGINVIGNNKESSPAFLDVFRYATLYNPTVIPVDGINADKYGGFSQVESFVNFNPLAIIKQSTNNLTTNYFQTNANASFEITDGLKLSGLYSYFSTASVSKSYYNKAAYYLGYNYKGLVDITNDKVRQNFYEAKLNYTKRLGKFYCNASIGYNLLNKINTTSDESSSGFDNDDPNYNWTHTGSMLGSTSTASYGFNYSSIFARTSWSYDDNYFLSGNLNKQGELLSYGVSSAVELKNFVNKFDFNVINSLKLRAGFGSIGSKQEINLGLSFELFKSKLSGSFDFYTRQMNNPTVIPATLFNYNTGNLKSSGVELDLNYTAFFKKNFKWNTSLALSATNNTYRSYVFGTTNVDLNTVLYLGNSGEPGRVYEYYNFIESNKPLGQIRGYRYAGGADKNGNMLAYDYNGVAKPYTQLNDSSKVTVGNGLPTMTIGWTNSFKWKNFELIGTLRGVFGHSLVNQFRESYELNNKGLLRVFNQVHTKYNNSQISNNTVADFYVEKADFVRLDNLTLAYEVPLNNGKFFKKIRLYVSANNLFTITDYTGADPEVRYQDPGPISFGAFSSYGMIPNSLVNGIDRPSTYLPTRTFSFGLNLGF